MCSGSGHKQQNLCALESWVHPWASLGPWTPTLYAELQGAASLSENSPGTVGPPTRKPHPMVCPPHVPVILLSGHSPASLARQQGQMTTSQRKLSFPRGRSPHPPVPAAGRLVGPLPGKHLGQQPLSLTSSLKGPLRLGKIFPGSSSSSTCCDELARFHSLSDLPWKEPETGSHRCI